MFLEKEGQPTPTNSHNHFSMLAWHAETKLLYPLQRVDWNLLVNVPQLWCILQQWSNMGNWLAYWEKVVYRRCQLFRNSPHISVDMKRPCILWYQSIWNQGIYLNSFTLSRLMPSMQSWIDWPFLGDYHKLAFGYFEYHEPLKEPGMYKIDVLLHPGIVTQQYNLIN